MLSYLVKVIEPCSMCKGKTGELCLVCNGSGKQQRMPTVEERLDYLEDQLDGFGDLIEHDKRGIIIDVKEMYS